MGNNTALVFRAAFIVSLASVLVVRVVYHLKGRANRAAQGPEREGIVSVGLRLALALALIALAPLYLIYPTWWARFDFPLPAALQWFGIPLACGGLVLLMWTHHTLGRQWSTGLRLVTDHRLMTKGPYMRVRHPMYTSIFILAAAWTLLTANLLIAAGAALTVALIARRTRAEEAMMVEAFGDEYLAYTVRTGRFWPRRRKQQDMPPPI